MTLPEFQSFMRGFAEFHSANRDDDMPSDAEYLAALAEEMEAGRA